MKLKAPGEKSFIVQNVGHSVICNDCGNIQETSDEFNIKHLQKMLNEINSIDKSIIWG
jgi:Fe2+ or Zn2+ uptake regulation protein